MKLYFSLLIAIVFIGCSVKEPSETVNHVIVNRFTKPPIGVHEEISRKNYGVLENGDTVPISENQRIGDTIKYQYYHVEH